MIKSEEKEYTDLKRLKYICYISEEEGLFLNHLFLLLAITIKANFLCSENSYLVNEGQKMRSRDMTY